MGWPIRRTHSSPARDRVRSGTDSLGEVHRPATEPRVGIVIPVYNGADHLTECLDSLLAQTYQYWRAVIVNNCSTDQTGAIADRYARSDPRINVMHCAQFLGQAENYNRGISAVLADTEYVKIIEADNVVTSACLEELLRVAESDPEVGVVGSCWLYGKRIVGSGVQCDVNVMPGLDAWRLLIGWKEDSAELGGPPTTQLYRTTALKGVGEWFRPRIFYDDVDLFVRLLEKWKFGYVHQVLSNVRRDNGGMLDSYYDFDFGPAERYFLICDYSKTFGEGQWLAATKRKWTEKYYGALAAALLSRRGDCYWKFHQKAFHDRNERINRILLTKALALRLCDLALNPKSTIEKAWHRSPWGRHGIGNR